jgi:thiamine-monophosphate kinase
MTVRLKDVGEKNLLAKLRRFLGDSHPSVIRIFSEDCAVLKGDSGQYKLFTTDALVQDVHFRTNYADPYSIGRKALLVNLSDISAMGGTPSFFLLSAGFPEEISVDFVEELYQGMLSVAAENQILFAGGNLTQSPQIILDIFMCGTVAADEVLFRNRGKAGDSLFVTGKLGGSAAGLKCLKNGYRLGEAGNSAIEQLIRAHLEPPNMNHAARKIAASKLANTMIDLSDGLAGDLAEICRESKTGAIVQLSQLPINASIRELASAMDWDPEQLALYGGEDYHLLFTVSAEKRSEFLQIMDAEKIVVFEIGNLTAEPGKIHAISEDGKQFQLKAGYEHF